MHYSPKRDTTLAKLSTIQIATIAKSTTSSVRPPTARRFSSGVSGSFLDPFGRSFDSIEFRFWYLRLLSFAIGILGSVSGDRGRGRGQSVGRGVNLDGLYRAGDGGRPRETAEVCAAECV